MCGQEGRLPCQCLGSDRDTTRTRPTLHLLIPDCKQRPEFILIIKTLFLVCSLYNFVWPKKENYLVSATTGIDRTVSKWLYAVPCGGPLQHLGFILHEKYWEIFHQKWICFHSILYVSCVVLPLLSPRTFPKIQIFFFSKAIIFFNINLLSTSKLLFSDITLSFWGLF